MHELHKLTATETVALLKRREVSPLELVDAAEAHAADDVDLHVGVPDAPEVVPVLPVDAVEVAADRLGDGPVGHYRAFSFSRISFIALNEKPASDGSPNGVMFQRIGCRRPWPWYSANCSTISSGVPPAMARP